LINEVVETCRTLIQKGESPYTEKTPRILLTGVPIGLGSGKVAKILKESGSSVAVFENCSGYKQTFLVDEDKDPGTALAEQYLSIPCSVMNPNQGRYDLLSDMIAGLNKGMKADSRRQPQNN